MLFGSCSKAEAGEVRFRSLFSILIASSLSSNHNDLVEGIICLGEASDREVSSQQNWDHHQRLTFWDCAKP
jgi:hypothetical protein